MATTKCEICDGKITQDEIENLGMCAICRDQLDIELDDDAWLGYY